MPDLSPKRGRPSLKEAQKQLRENVILDAAEELLKIKGYAAMTLDDLIEAVGIAKATLYQHFHSKEELAVRVVLRVMREVAEFLNAQDPALPAQDRWASFVRRVLEMRFGERAIPIGDIAHHLRPQGKPHPSIRDAEEALCNQIESLIGEAQADGTVRRDVSKSFICQNLIATIHDDRSASWFEDSRLTPEEIIVSFLCIMKA